VQSSILFVPEKKSIDGMAIDDLFALTHCAFLNPLNPTEVVTANGLVGVMGRMSGSSKQLFVVSDKGKVNTKDPTQTFDVIRPLYTHFSQDGKCLQTVRIIGEVDVMINKRQVRAIFLASSIEFPGSPWKHHASSSSGDSLIDFSLSQRTPSSSPSAVNIPSKSARSTHASLAGTSSPSSLSSSSVSSPQSKVKAGAEEMSFLMRLKQAPEVQASMSDFIARFCHQPPSPSDQGNVVRAYLDELMNLIVYHRAWASASQEELEIAQEAAEKYVMQKIYKFCFSNTTEDIARDKILAARFAELQFITQDHLDISPHHRDAQRTQQAIEELRLINASKTPRGKLTRILNCCKAIYSILNRAAQQGHPSAGADEFLPLLNYVVLKANPAQLHSNIQFILRFRAPNKMITEAGYYFTHLESTISWLEHVEASKLTIDPDTFHTLLKQAQDAALAKSLQQQQQKAQAAAAAAAGSTTTTTTTSSSSSTSSSMSPLQVPVAVKSQTTAYLLDISGLSTPTPTINAPTSSGSGTGTSASTSSPLASSLLSDLVWHSSPTQSSSSTSLIASANHASITPSTSSASLAANSSTTPSRPSSNSRSATRDDDSEASVLELQDSDSPLRFLNYNHVWDVKVGELEELFQAYRMLAHENYQLRTDLYRTANKLGP